MSKIEFVSPNGTPLVFETNITWAGIDVAKGKELRPDRIIYNGRTTIVYWNDGTKNVSTCSENDVFDKKMGLAACLLKKMFGKKVHKKKLYDRMVENAEVHNPVSEVVIIGNIDTLIDNMREVSRIGKGVG